MTLDTKKYNRLVVFGSSDTYGAHLPDCNPDTQLEIKPSIYAWPNILGEKMSLPVNNMATPGASNKEILLSILTSSVVETDLVLVCWTYVNRTYIVKDDNSLDKIYPNSKNVQAESYYRLYDINNLVHNTMLNISHANLFFLNKKCDIYNFYTDPLVHLKTNSILPNPSLVYLNKFKLTVDRSTDNMHPGLQSHINIANFVHNILND